MSGLAIESFGAPSAPSPAPAPALTFLLPSPSRALPARPFFPLSFLHDLQRLRQSAGCFKFMGIPLHGSVRVPAAQSTGMSSATPFSCTTS